jgi:hypothetical protein
MATISAAVTQVSGQAAVITWASLTSATSDVGEAVEMPYLSDRSVQVFGTFGTGGACTLQGSNDGTNWATLDDTQGTAIAQTAAGVKQLAPITRYIRPNITAGSGATITCVIYCARSA